MLQFLLVGLGGCLGSFFALLNIALQLVLGLLAVGLGLALVKGF